MEYAIALIALLLIAAVIAFSTRIGGSGASGNPGDDVKPPRETDV